MQFFSQALQWGLNLSMLTWYWNIILRPFLGMPLDEKYFQNKTFSMHTGDFPGGSAIKNLPASRRHRRLGFNPWVKKILWRRAWQATPAFLLEKSQGQRSLGDYSPWGHKESDTTAEAEHTHFACTQGLTATHKKCELFAVFSPRILPLTLPRAVALCLILSLFLANPTLIHEKRTKGIRKILPLESSWGLPVTVHSADTLI